MRWLHGITDSMDKSLSKLWEMVKDREAWVCCSPWGHRVRQDLATEQQHSTLKINCNKKFGSTFQGPGKQMLLMMTQQDNADYRAFPASHNVLDDSPENKSAFQMRLNS